MIARYTARRAVDGGAMDELVKTITTQPKTIGSLLEGMLNGMEGRTDLKPPAAWQQAYAALKKRNDRASELAAEIAGLFGDTEAAQRSLATLKNKNAAPDLRKKALQALAAQQRKELLPELPALMEEPALRTDVIKSIAAFDDKDLGSLLINNYKNFNEAEKSAAIQTLASRPAYGWILTRALKENTIPKRDVSANEARQLRRVVGSGFVEVWGPIDDTAPSTILKLLSFFRCQQRVIIKKKIINIVFIDPGFFYDHMNMRRLCSAGVGCRTKTAEFVFAFFIRF